MAESTSTFYEDMTESMSPDIFSDCEVQEAEPQNMNESVSTEGDEPELMDDSLGWKGTSMNEIYRDLDIYFHEQPPIRLSEHHTVLFELPIPNRRPPKPFPLQPVDKWSENYVRMPHSPKCSYTTLSNTDDREVRIRWEVIQEALLQNFVSTIQLEVAILSYNNKYASQWNFNALHTLFEESDDEEETKVFFEQLLPKIIQLALQLPALVTGPIPLLKQHTNNSISFSQLQVASLLANSFLCTFPRRNAVRSNSEYALYPHINFNGLFSASDKYPRKLKVKMEKLRCIIHYFRRVTTSHPEGTLTIQRRFIPKSHCPKWDRMKCPLPPLHITRKGTIEDDGAGLLQVDFANKYIGGGVLNSGCVQEEIRFVICPELLVTMLVTEVLDDTEALIITGAERYSTYTGYGNTFEWAGNYVDETPRDSSGRRKTSIVAIDALFFTQAYRQNHGRNIIRELNKAYVGFSSCEMSFTQLSGIATGNWGCGAFRGDPHLKSLIQLMAAAVYNRPVVYFTFGDKELRDNIINMYSHLVAHEVNVGRLFTLLQSYDSEAKRYQTLYDFLHKRAKIKPLMKYFSALSSTSTKPPTNSKKVSPKRYDIKPIMINKNVCVQKIKPELKNEDIRILLEQDDNDSYNEKQASESSSELIDEDISEEEKTAAQRWYKWIKESDDKKLVRHRFSQKETQNDVLSKQSGTVIESEDGLVADEFLSCDSDNETSKPTEKLKNNFKIERADQIPDSLINKQSDIDNESTSTVSNTNNFQVKKSPNPQKSEQKLNFREGKQKKIHDFFSRKVE